jgi:hypothetical protein
MNQFQRRMPGALYSKGLPLPRLANFQITDAETLAEAIFLQKKPSIRSSTALEEMDF